MWRLRKPLRRRTLAVLLLALASACRSAGGGLPGPVVLQSQPLGPARPEVDPSRAALFRALQSALAEGEDDLAARMVANLEGRPLSARERELVTSAKRVLTGRALVRSLELALVSEPDGEREGSYRLLLAARSTATREVCLRLAPADLKRLRATMDARGVEGLEYGSQVTTVLGDLCLVPTIERRIELLRYDLPLGRALGARERWRLETRSGEIACDGEVYPAGSVRVEGCERERISPLLPAGSAAPEELAARLEALETPRPLGLLEVALRIPVEDREEALDALAPVVERLARSQPERIELAEPALRWLTQNRELGPDPQGWARYLELRGQAPAAAPAPDGLDLPAPRRPDRPPPSTTR